MPCSEYIYEKCSNGHDTSYLCHKGPYSICPLCEKEKRRAERQQKEEGERKQKREQEKKDHELKMAEIEKKIREAREALHETQVMQEREQARRQKEEDLRNALDMAERARPMQGSSVGLGLASGSFMSRLFSPFAPPQSPIPNQPTQSPTSPSAAAPAVPNSASSTTKSSTGTSVPQQSVNLSANLPDEWKLKPSGSKAQWERQKEIEGTRNDAIDAIMKMTGLESVKEQLLRIKSKIDTAKRQGASLKGERFNIVFLGNPGTGTL